MRLEDVSAVIRPRGQWEAVDLGFAMTRKLFPRLLAAWSLTVVPLWMLLLGLSWFIPLGWSLVAIWWLKPIYDRVPLFIMSRSLFGATPTLGAVLKAWPRMIFSRLIWVLFYRVPWAFVVPHFSWSRALTLAAIDLEQQKGKALRERQQVLLRLAGGRVGMLAALCGAYEMILVFALLTLAMMMTGDPAGAGGMGEAFIDMAFRRGEMEPWLRWTLIGGYLVSMTLVELFYVGGGFGLYLNCRTHLEGWDVEISFRRLAKRLQKVAVLVAFLGCAAVGVGAELEKEKSTEKSSIEEVLSHPDFKVHTMKQRKVADDGKDLNWDLNGVSWLAQFGQILYYMIIIGVVSWLVWLIYKNRHLFQRTGVKTIQTPSLARTVMGMDVTPESLPADILAAAMARWSAGDSRGALSLLYRGSLSWLVNHAHLPVREGDTEGDCVRHTRKLVEPVRRDYFAELTKQWVLVAYAERDPAAGDMERLLQSWPFREHGGAQ